MVHTQYSTGLSCNRFGSVKSITAALDNTPPSVSINIEDGATLTDSGVITITATDDGCGVAKIFYRIDGGEWVSS